MMQTADAVARFFNNSPKYYWKPGLITSSRRNIERIRKKCVKLGEWSGMRLSHFFSDLFLPVISCFEEIVLNSSGEWNRETRSDTQSLLLALSQFSFVATLVATQSVLAYTKSLSVKLQGAYVDVARGH